jgi:hypothetical protein
LIYGKNSEKSPYFQEPQYLNLKTKNLTTLVMLTNVSIFILLGMPNLRHRRMRLPEGVLWTGPKFGMTPYVNLKHYPKNFFAASGLCGPIVLIQ